MEIIKMSKKELYKGEVISKVIKTDFTQKMASEELNMSLRQIKRLCKRFRESGLEGLIHKSRSKVSHRKISSSARAQVLELIRENYSDFGPQLAKEQLEKRHQLKYSREWIRVLMIEAGLWKVKKRKKITLHQRRNRRSREGELLQIDGSPEYWLEKRGPKCSLINMVDDATGKIMELRFVKEECLEGYFLGMKRYIETYGRPIAVYSDRHSIFKSPKKEGKVKLTQFGRAMKELNIKLIYANSPQAKGRVERSHGTLQDRLIKLMRLDGISSIEEANKYLESFKEDYNQQFAKVARNPENAYRRMPEDLDLNKILCRKEERKISKNLEIQYMHKTYQLTSKNNSRRLIGKTALILELGNEIEIEFEGQRYDYKIYEDQSCQNQVMDRKKIDAFLDKKQPMTINERNLKKIATNF